MIQINISITCDECDDRVDLPQVNIEDVYEGTFHISETEALPNGWKMFENRILCPKHKVEKVVLIDGKEIRRFCLEAENIKI
jgi:hypothetical protein